MLLLTFSACCGCVVCCQAHRVMRLADGRIAGIVMEKANGRNVDKTLKDPK